MRGVGLQDKLCSGSRRERILEIKEKYMNKVEKGEGMVTGSSQNEKGHKTSFETCQVCDEISLYCTICVNRTGIAGFCSVKLGATCGPRS